MKEQGKEDGKKLSFIALLEHTKNFSPNDLTQLQEDIIYSIETLNKSLFCDLGGPCSISMDFEINENGDFPLGVA